MGVREEAGVFFENDIGNEVARQLRVIDQSYVEKKIYFYVNGDCHGQKIFKKVKPKQLNGKQITGEMLLELAIAYTGAINEGTLPNIQNAWSYVC